MFLERVLATSPLFTKVIERGDLIAFADDILIMADSRDEATEVVKEFETIKESGLHLNKEKTKIITDLKDMKGVS